MCQLCEFLGVPLAQNKIFGPDTTMIFLGIEIHSQMMVIRLPEDKLSALKTLLGDWERRRTATKRDIFSLIGKLSFACKVVKPGRMLLWRLIDLSTSVDSIHHFVTLGAEGREDVRWWRDFLPSWNGVSII